MNEQWHFCQLRLANPQTRLMSFFCDLLVPGSSVVIRMSAAVVVVVVVITILVILV